LSSTSTDGLRILASDGFIREVDEELQRDRMAKLWKRYGPIAVGIALVLVLGTAGKVGWDAWQVRQLEQQGAAFAAAEATLRQNDPSAAAEQFSSLATAQRGDIAALAKLREAEARIAGGDSESALDLLDELARTSGIDPILRDYAAVAAAQRRLGTIDPAALQESLAPQMAGDSPFRHSAREIAALAALQAGDEAAALEGLRQLEEDLATPEDMRRRVAELRAALGATDGPADQSASSSADAS
jgi:hypothetical protein